MLEQDFYDYSSLHFNFYSLEVIQRTKLKFTLQYMNITYHYKYLVCTSPVTAIFSLLLEKLDIK